jgi:hypothetical protein
VIVTFNEKDFPPDALAEFDVTAQHPDTFLRHLIDLDPNRVRDRLTEMVQRLERPSMTVDAYIDMLQRQSLPDTAAALRDLFTAV